MRFIPLFLLFALPTCADETLSGYADRTATYVLQEMEGQTVTFAATISFPEEGRVAGQGPCNSYSATQSAPYPWFDMGRTVTTRAACLDLAGEQAFLQALRRMTLAEVSGDVLILSNDDGQSLVFDAQP